MKFPEPIQKLINQFSKLPTVGPKTAERYTFHLLKQSTLELKALAESIIELKEKTTICKQCFSIAEVNPCTICTDNKRQIETLCIVGDARNMLSIEATGNYKGLYFILGGELNQIEGTGPDQLNITPLIEKLKTKKISEIILGLNPTIEGETTTLYLAKLIRPYQIKITRLAKGLPMGADLEYVDELTLTNALKYRNEL